MAVLLGGLPVWGDSLGTRDTNKTQLEANCAHGFGTVWEVCLEHFEGQEVYGHGVLGSKPEWVSVSVTYGKDDPNWRIIDAKTLRFSQKDHVFEDVRPRILDVDHDGDPEIVLVQSHFSYGARLAIYKTIPELKLLAATPYIGTRYRWLAPIGVADFNGDGDMDVAYVDRPHLAKTLRVWTYRDGGLTEIASIKGVTNHSIGEPFITSSIRTCKGRPEMILNDAQRTNIVSVFFENGKLTYKDLGKYTGPQSVLNPPKC